MLWPRKGPQREQNTTVIVSVYIYKNKGCLQEHRPVS